MESSVSGQAGQTVSLVDSEGTVLASFTARLDFQTAVASAPGMTDGQTYGLVVGDAVAGADEDGYVASGSVDAASAVQFTASTSSQGGIGGMGGTGGQPGAPTAPSGEAPGGAGAMR